MVTLYNPLTPTKGADRSKKAKTLDLSPNTPLEAGLLADNTFKEYAPFFDVTKSQSIEFDT